MERSTRQRQVIERALARSARPLSPQELLSEAQQDLPRLGIATVYRALRDGQDGGTIRTVEVPGAVTRYELSSHGHHHHFHCTICGRVFEVEGCPGDLDRLAPAGFSVTGHEILLTGTCAECLTANAPVLPRASASPVSPAHGHQHPHAHPLPPGDPAH